ncbi:FimV/HubP family polar landmark protein [Oceanisphaera ostreae]|uniref:FimV/HubP family polar landmark protein n=1 Tax=Oceanisphaera ostreae TaxID=914151 RepID=A0ABW3KHS9_9GAMM
MKQLRPYLGAGLALWLGYSATAAAQGEFYIELRGPESADATRLNSAQPPADSAAGNQPTAQPATASANTAAAPSAISAGRYGPIRSTDTLWAIAARNTRAPITVQQTMVALYHLNAQAFVRGNINYLQRGAQLRLPTDTQATQRSAGEAQIEFSRLSRQGSRRVTRAATAPSAEKTTQIAQVTKPAVPAVPASPAPQVAKPAPQAQVAEKTTPVAAPSAPMAAQPPGTISQTQPETPLAYGLSEPKAAPASVERPMSAPSPSQVEDSALTRLQLQLMDELREQVAMSNEQLTALADNNQAMRQRLTQLTAEVEDLKTSRSTTGFAVEDIQAGEEKTKPQGWLSELLNNPLNLALILILPALLLLALFTLWWRNRERRDLAEQEQELSETSAMLEDERDDFEDLFGAADDTDPMLDDELKDIQLEQDVDEDAFTRFLEEQQLQEEQENVRQQETAEQPVPIDFDDDALFEDETPLTESDGDRVSNDDLDDVFADTASEQALPEDASPLEDTNSIDEPDDTFVTTDDNTAETLANSVFADSPLGDDTFADEPEDSAPADIPLAKEDYVSVDQLMAEAEAADGSVSERERKLDLELDDYADVIGQGDGVDIDADEGGIGAQLDLARAYIEIDDVDSARDLLNEAIERGNEAQQRDAQKLLQRLDKRG